jgi:hypothetical protein
MTNPSSPRRSPADQHRWNVEKAESEPYPVTCHVRVPVNEGLGGGSTMDCCGESRCVCVCPECGERSITGMICDACEQTQTEAA